MKDCSKAKIRKLKDFSPWLKNVGESHKYSSLKQSDDLTSFKGLLAWM